MIHLQPQSAKAGFRPDPIMDLVEWADTYLYLPRESSAEYGKYRSTRTPMAVEPLKELSMTSRTSKVVIQKPTQLAATTIGLIFLMGTADMWPGPTLMIMPTETLIQSFSKKRVDTTIKVTPQMFGKISDRKSRDTSNTILEKTFPGGAWRFAGSNSPAAYRSESVKYAIADDFDGFDLDIGGEGNPGDLLDRRTGTFKRHKIYINSSPTIRGLSNIEKEFENSSQGFFHVPCPECGHFQYLIFPQLKFDKENLSWIYYECEKCQAQINERSKSTMLPAGQYVHKHPERDVKGFTYNALVTPIGWRNTWKKVAHEWMKSYKDPEKRKVFVNTLLAETYEDEGSRPGWDLLSSRAESYQITTVPEGGLILSAGVDVQDNRWAVLVDAWGPGEENWVIFWDEIYGDPGKQEEWNKLDEILYRHWDHKSGIQLQISSMAVDTGGHFTSQAYNYCRLRGPIVAAVKGSSQTGKPIVGRPTMQDVDYMGQTIKEGVQLWPVGTDTAKGLIYNRLKIRKEGPSTAGAIHFPIGLPEDFYQQLTAEKLITRFVKGYPKPEWVKIYPRNEALDCKVYSYFAALRAGLTFIQWEGLLDKILRARAPQTEAARPKPKQHIEKRGRW
jgi:phage terminase large subunit GpA-like protein